jgi:hypothetical protein
VFLSPRNHIDVEERAINFDDFHRNDLCRTLLEYDDKSKFPVVKKVTLALRGEKNCAHRFSSYFITSFLWNSSVLFLYQFPNAASAIHACADSKSAILG